MKTSATSFRSRSTASSLTRLRTNLRLGGASLVIGGALAVACNAHANNLYFDADGDNTNGLNLANGTWSTTVAEWSPVVAATTTNTDEGWTNSAADVANFGSTGVTAPTADFTVTIGENLIMSGISVSSVVTKNLLITAGANNYTINLGNAGIGTNQPTTVATTIDAQITGTSGLLKYNAGTLILARDNTYTGTTIVKGNTGTGNGGILQIGNGGTTGSLGTGSVQFTANGTETGAPTVRFNHSNDETVTNSFNVSNTVNTPTSGTGIAIGGIIAQAGGGKLTLSGAVNLGTSTTAGQIPTLTYNIGHTTGLAVDTEVSGVISGTGLVAKTGAGVEVFSGANTYTGGFTLTTGTTEITTNTVTAGSVITSGAFGTGTITTATGSFEGDVAGTAHTVANPITFGIGTLGIASSGGTDGALNFTGAVNVSGSGGHTLTSASNGDVTFAGVISGAHTVALGATGTGRIIFSNANTYGLSGSTSTAINAGTLVVANTTGSATGTFPVSVNSTGILSGGSGAANTGASQTLGGASRATYNAGVLGLVSSTVTVASGGNLAPGNASVGTLTIGALTLSTGATATYEFNGTANDFVSVTGALTLATGTTSTITLLQEGKTTPFAAAGVYNIFGYGTGSSIDTTTLSVANQQSGFNYSFVNDTTDSLVQLDITAVPEPSSWLAGLLSVGMLGFSLRRRVRAMVSRLAA